MTNPLRVLVVDDEILIADHISLILEDAGHMVIGLASSAEEAMDLLTRDIPDVAVLDIRLKGHLDGIQLAAEMKRAGLKVPHIFITGSGDPETKERAAATSPSAFIQKPFDDRSLITAITAAVSGANAGWATKHA